ncbi:MAG: Ppx/GppA family phosphatase [Alphaproteobacteria bacterium]|nr:Ppx/GppA family phosphatase [Alphaproteobacteria bacterium]MCB9930522.1 Ppx/GppA family phosphatase [Alphaproteobacteria bacterium]
MRRAAVIDIGSNSVRLVVYGIKGSCLISLFDEKAMCGLGRGLSESGTLHPEGRRQAMCELRRFTRVAADEEPEALFLFATSAVRDASDGEAFVADVTEDTGLSVEVISGLEEARLAAEGVAGAIPGATGLVGDLGGGSLELVRLENGRVREQASLPIGALRRSEAADTKATMDWIDQALATVPWLPLCGGQPFFVVGGAWRAFARAHMQQQNYPLDVIHHYEMTADSAKWIAELMAKMSKPSADLLETISKRRRAIMPYAAQVLARVVTQAEPSTVIASSHGLREGYIRDRVSIAEGDPLLDFSRIAGAATARIPPEAQVIRDWLLPVFRHDPLAPPRLIEAACWLADLAGREHPDRRAYLGYSRGLNLSSVAIDHRERGFLGTAMRCRYGGVPRDGDLEEARQLTSPEAIASAIRLGVVLRMAQAISPTGKGLRGTTLALTPEHLRLAGPADLLCGETVQRRLAAAAGTFDRQPLRAFTS